MQPAANEPETQRESPNCSQQSLEALLRGETLILLELLKGNSCAAASPLPDRVWAASAPQAPAPPALASQPALTPDLRAPGPAHCRQARGPPAPPWLSPQPRRSAVGSALSPEPTRWRPGAGGPAACPCPLHSGLEAPVGHRPRTLPCPGGGEGLLCGLWAPSGSAKVNSSGKGMSPAPQGRPGGPGPGGASGDAPGRPASCSSPSPWRRGGRRGRSRPSSCTCPGRTCADGEEGVRRC